MSDTARRMMSLFGGFRGAHGTHGDMKKNPNKGGKLEIKQSARTLREPVTLELWERHLRGEYYLGIIPITEESEAVFGCIDVDRYDINLGQVAQELERRRIPMLVCRSKSGGAHVYMFLSRPAPAADLRAQLKQIAASMGWGDCEIYPKQSQMLADRGDLGNWLNMPYHNSEHPERYGIKKTGAAMTIAEFLSAAERLRFDLMGSEVSVEEPQDDTLNDGPPCLQHLAAVGLPEGTRNNGLFSMGVFCKKKYGSRWKEMLEEYNRKYLSPPLPAEEVSELIANLERREYQYKCKDQPCVSYCNVSLCRTRKFGIGGSGRYPQISGLSKLNTDPAIWFLDIDDSRIELTTRQLRDYREFQSVCMEVLTVTFMPMKAETWLEMVGTAMENAILIEAAPEMGTRGQFLEHLEDFLMDNHRGEKVDDLWLGKPWHAEEEGRYYFRLRDLSAYLEREGFTAWGRNTLGQRVEELGGKRFLNVRGRGVNVFWVDARHVESVPQIDLPQARRDPV